MEELQIPPSHHERFDYTQKGADRISRKHLITLEPAISRNQRDEMRIQAVQLVIPKSIAPTYSSEQQRELMNLEGLIDLVRRKQ